MKDDYFQLLDEFTDKIVRKEYRKAKHYLETDNRYQAIEKKHRREDWFEEWQKSAYKEYKKKKKKQKELALQEFEKRLREGQVVKLGADWEDIRDSIDFMNEDFVKELRDREMSKIYDDVYEELEQEERRRVEKERQERKKQLKQDRVKFGEFIDELVKDLKLHAKLRFDDENVVKLMENDERYKRMKERQGHKIEDIFSERMDKLKYDLADDKKIFKQFVKSKEKEIVIGEKDDLQSVLPRFKELMNGGDEKKDGDKDCLLLNVSEQHLGLLLLEYIAKKQRNCKDVGGEGMDVDLVKNDTKKKGDIKINIKNGNGVNAKKRQREDLNDNEPSRKRQKTDHHGHIDVTIHDPKIDRKNEEMDEGEIEELEEGELSDIDEEKHEDKDNKNNNDDMINDKDDNDINNKDGIKKLDKENKNHHKKKNVSSSSSGKRSRSRRRSRSRSSSYSGSSSHDRSDNDYSSGSDESDSRRRRRHKKRDRDRRKNKKRDHHDSSRHRKKNKRGRDRDGKSGRSRDRVGDILYGMGSDFEEDDLYYRGDINRRGNDGVGGIGNSGSEDNTGGNPVMMHLNNGRGGNGHHRGRRRGGGGGGRRRGGGRGGDKRGGHWRRNNGGIHEHEHHDLDYHAGAGYNDTEINADSYNLDNDEMARWNTGH